MAHTTKFVLEDGKKPHREFTVLLPPSEAPHRGDWVTIAGFRGVVKTREWTFVDLHKIKDSRFLDYEKKELTVTVGR